MNKIQKKKKKIKLHFFRFVHLNAQKARIKKPKIYIKILLFIYSNFRIQINNLLERSMPEFDREKKNFYFWYFSDVSLKLYTYMKLDSPPIDIISKETKEKKKIKT